MLTSAELRSWILRVTKWDGFLPAVVWSSPFVVRLMLPNQRGPTELTALALPIIAFFIRLKIGRKYISTINCRIVIHRFQMVALYIGLFVLALLDAVMILIHIMPQGAAFATMTDVVVCVVLYSMYIAAMAIAMYPGTGHPFDRLSTKSRDRNDGWGQAGSAIPSD